MSLAHRLGFAAIACLFAAPLPAGAALIMHKDLSHEMALAVAEGAMQACLAKGYATSAVVVDRDGETLVAMRGDGAGPHTVENARRKAYTANTFKMPSGGLRQEIIGSQFGRAPAGDVAEHHRHRRRRADQGRQRRDRRRRGVRFAGHRLGVRQRRYRKDQRPIAVAVIPETAKRLPGIHSPCPAEESQCRFCVTSGYGFRVPRYARPRNDVTSASDISARRNRPATAAGSRKSRGCRRARAKNRLRRRI